MVKYNIQSAFQLLPVHLDDFCLQGISFGAQLGLCVCVDALDVCMPIYEWFSSFLK